MRRRSSAVLIPASDSSGAQSIVVACPIGAVVASAGPSSERFGVWWESLEPTAAIRLELSPPESIASSQKRIASGVNGLGPGSPGTFAPAGPVEISTASTLE